jgi:glycosyltransferase involved in cell wall biosynthesis
VTGIPLLDLHHLGRQQTGNESWARSMGAALFELDGDGAYDVAFTDAVLDAEPPELPYRKMAVVSASSSRRLAADLPAAMRRFDTSAVLVQYTAPLSRVPAVVAVHDLSFEDPRAAEWLPRATRLRYRATISASVRRAAHVLVDSDYTRRDLMRRYRVSPDQVTVAPLAVDPRFAARLRATPEDRSGRPTVLVVGTVLPRKNLQVVVRAVRLLRDRGSDLALRVVGPIRPTGQPAVDEAQRQLGDDVTFTGYATQAELARELRSAHVLAFPSLFEGFGIPVLEAMAAGLPVVVSDRTSLPEVAADAGLVVGAEDVEAWAEALTKALRDDIRTRLVAAGAAREREFRWERSAVIASRALAEASGESR